MSTDRADLRYPVRRELRQIGTYTSEREKIREPVDLSAPDVVKAHDKANRKRHAELTATARDEKFKMKVFWVTLAVLIVADYLYLPTLMPRLELPWFGHSALVVSAAFLCVVLVTQLRVLRTLRRIIATALLLAVVLGLCLLLDVLPHAY